MHKFTVVGSELLFQISGGIALFSEVVSAFVSQL